MDDELKYILDTLDSDKDDKERYIFEQLKSKINSTGEEREEYFYMLVRSMKNYAGGINHGNVN